MIVCYRDCTKAQMISLCAVTKVHLEEVVEIRKHKYDRSCTHFSMKSPITNNVHHYDLFFLSYISNFNNNNNNLGEEEYKLSM